ncbi:hypothetical protein HK104_009716, partial [Borealophlyctis nickersoniae]
LPADPYGAWSVVETPAPSPPRPVSSEDKAPEVDEDEEESAETVKGFKIQEKTLAVDDGGAFGTDDGDGGTTLFKKRKLGGGKGARNTRKRIE